MSCATTLQTGVKTRKLLRGAEAAYYFTIKSSLCIGAIDGLRSVFSIGPQSREGYFHPRTGRVLDDWSRINTDRLVRPASFDYPFEKHCREHSAGVRREITAVEAAPERKVSRRRPTERIEHW